jgi:hypothetical protein
MLHCYTEMKSTQHLTLSVLLFHFEILILLVHFHGNTIYIVLQPQLVSFNCSGMAGDVPFADCIAH